MNIRKKILEIHSTGIIYFYPGAINYASDNPPSCPYWCELSMGSLIKYYAIHVNNPPTERCYHGCTDTNGGSISIPTPKGEKQVRMTEEEIDWMSLEHTLREAINDPLINEENGMVRIVVSIKSEEL